MLKILTVCFCLLLHVLTGHTETSSATVITLKFSELKANKTYKVALSGVTLNDQKKLTHPNATIDVSNDKVLITTTVNFTGSELDVPLTVDPLSNFEANVEFPGSGKLRVEGISPIAFSGSAIPITKLTAPSSGHQLPPTCVVAPQCDLEKRQCPGDFQCYSCGDFCDKVEYICCNQNPFPPSL